MTHEALQHHSNTFEAYCVKFRPRFGVFYVVLCVVLRTPWYEFAVKIPAPHPAAAYITTCRQLLSNIDDALGTALITNCFLL